MASITLDTPTAESAASPGEDHRPRRVRMAIAALAASVVAAEIVLQILCLVLPSLDALLRPAWARASATTPAVPSNLPDPVFGVHGNPAFAEHDADGFRNTSIPPRAAIVALGDSQTYGSMVGREEAWPAVLARSRETAVHNLAFGAWGPWEYSRVLDRALAFRPEVVLVGVYLGNDLYDAYRATYVEHRATGWSNDEAAARLAMLARAGSPDDAAARLFAAAPQAVAARSNSLRGWVSAHVRLYGLARAVKDRLAGHREAPSGLATDDWDAVVAWANRRPELCRVLDANGRRTILTSAYRVQALDLDDARVAEGLRLTVAALTAMAEKTRTAGAELVVVLIPTKESVFAPAGDAEAAKLIAKEQAAAGALRAGLAAGGVRIIDVLPALRGQLEAGEQPYPISADGHPNPAGHRAIAEAVAAQLP